MLTPSAKLRSLSFALPKLVAGPSTASIVGEVTPRNDESNGSVTPCVGTPVYGVAQLQAGAAQPLDGTDEAISPKKGEIAKPKVNAVVVIPESKRLYTSNIYKNLVKLGKLNVFSKIYVINCFFLLTSMLLAVFSNILFNTLEDVPSYSSFVTSGNLIIAGFIILFFALDSVFRENEFQMVLFIVVCCAITVLMIGNSILKTVELIRLFVQKLEWILLLQLFLNSCFSILVISQLIVFIVLAYPVYKSFGWKLFKTVGTNKTLLRAFKIYNIWITFLKADLVLTIDLSILNLFFAPSVSWAWFFIVFFTLLIHLIGYLALLPLFRFAARHEIRILFVAVLCYQVLFPMWLAGKTIQSLIFMIISGEAYQNPWRNLKPLGMSNWTMDVNFSYAYMGGLSVLGLIFRAMVFILSILVLLHMKKGLKEVFLQRKLYNKAKRKKRKDLIEETRKERMRNKKKVKRDRIKQEMATKMASQIAGDISCGIGLGRIDPVLSDVTTNGTVHKLGRGRAATAIMAKAKDGSSVPVVVEPDVDLSESDDDLSKSDRFSSSDSACHSEDDEEEELAAIAIQQEQQRRQQRRRIII